MQTTAAMTKNPLKALAVAAAAVDNIGTRIAMPRSEKYPRPRGTRRTMTRVRRRWTRPPPQAKRSVHARNKAHRLLVRQTAKVVGQASPASCKKKKKILGWLLMCYIYMADPHYKDVSATNFSTTGIHGGSSALLCTMQRI